MWELLQSGPHCKGHSSQPCIRWLSGFDEEMRNCFMLSTAIENPQAAWSWIQLSLRFGGLGFCSVSYHAPAASCALSDIGQPDNIHLKHDITLFNSRVSQPDPVTVESVLAFPSIPQRELSRRIDDRLFNSLLNSSLYPKGSLVIHLCSPAGSWQSVVPSPGLGLHLEPNECQIMAGIGYFWSFYMPIIPPCCL